ncbi:hypothetical protein AAFF_G00324290 [Aldrovandia affinis]|uniref:Uncharacterized protein n=1 Tax=Aldrovandia affinis TaxID=143900 RepID=A0AAD7R7B3_9TELE|nr:hypothetical protein AAFF_G00324290 [Aldrovandia affinis]
MTLTVCQSEAINETSSLAAFPTDLRLQVCLYYQGQLVQDFTTSTLEGCRILHGMVWAETPNGVFIKRFCQGTGPAHWP